MPRTNKRVPLAEGVLSVGLRLHLLQGAEIQEVVGSVGLMVEGVWVGQLDAVCHPLVEPDTLEIVVPAAHVRHHVEAHEPAQRWPCHPSCGMAAIKLKCPLSVLKESSKKGNCKSPKYISDMLAN